MLKIAIICGGPSLERGISLNSARSVLDHLPTKDIQVLPIYVDQDLQFYSISPAQLYSNTPADFDFKLGKMAAKLDADSLYALLKSADLVFPVIHGAFGEDGELQRILENWNIPFVGHGSDCCSQMFHKYEATQILKKNQFPSPLLIIIQRLPGQCEKH